MNVIKPLPSCSETVRSPRAKLVYVEALDALVQEDVLPDLSLCSTKECEPPFGGKENCEFYQAGLCSAAYKTE